LGEISILVIFTKIPTDRTCFLLQIAQKRCQPNIRKSPLSVTVISLKMLKYPAPPGSSLVLIRMVFISIAAHPDIEILTYLRESVKVLAYRDRPGALLLKSTYKSDGSGFHHLMNGPLALSVAIWR
jgi:hypothetical protein